MIYYNFTKLDMEAVGKLNALEDDMGVHILAVGPGPELAELNDEQVGQVQSLESDLGTTLLVFNEMK